jgi:hypothetical protein
MPVKQNSFTNIRVLLVLSLLTDRGILTQYNYSVVDRQICISLGLPIYRDWLTGVSGRWVIMSQSDRQVPYGM